jgi:hypothetical protein
MSVFPPLSWSISKRFPGKLSPMYLKLPFIKIGLPPRGSVTPLHQVHEAHGI